MRRYLGFLGKFLPFGYVVPTALEECYTWQQALAFIVKCLKELDDRVTALEEKENEQS